MVSTAPKKWLVSLLMIGMQLTLIANVVTLLPDNFSVACMINNMRPWGASNYQDNWVVVSNIFCFHPYLGKIPILTNIFQRGWNHQLVMHSLWVWMHNSSSHAFGTHARCLWVRMHIQIIHLANCFGFNRMHIYSKPATCDLPEIRESNISSRCQMPPFQGVGWPQEKSWHV